MSRRRRRPLWERPRKHCGRRNRLSRKRGRMAARRLAPIIADQIWKAFITRDPVHLGIVMVTELERRADLACGLPGLAPKITTGG